MYGREFGCSDGLECRPEGIDVTVASMKLKLVGKTLAKLKKVLKHFSVISALYDNEPTLT